MRLLLATLFLFLPQFLMACPAEADLADSGSEPGVALTRCHELGVFEIPSGRGNIQVTMFGTRESDEQFVLPILESLTFAGDSLADLGTLTTAPIEVFISPTDYIPAETSDASDNALAVASRAEGDTCLIVTYPTLMSDAFRFTMAHEFFHCVQFREFNQQERASGSGWWVEGTAEWFANFTYPNKDFSDGFVSGFDGESVETAITDMEYTNIVFFFWYSQNRGADAIVSLISAMPTGGGSQEDALAELIDDEALKQFATDYFDKNITQPGGRKPPSNPTYSDTERWEEDETKNFSAQRFRIYRARFEFACGEWEIEERDLEGLTTVQKQPDGEWEDVPEEITSEDGEDQFYRFVGVATGTDGFSVEIEAKKKLCSVCPRIIEDESPEACLIGEWTLVSGGLGAKIGQMLQNTDLENVDYPDLDGVLIFNEDGTFSSRTDDEGHLEAVTEKGRVLGDMSFNFESSGTWGINGEKLEQCSLPPEININLDTFDTRNDLSGSISQDEYLGPQIENRTTRKFTCDNGRLVLTEGGFFAPKIEWVYTK